MRKTANLSCLSILLIVALLLSLIPSMSVRPVSAHPGKMTWSIVDTPSTGNNIIVSPSEVNVIAIGFDDRTFYAVDIPGDPPGGTYPDGKLYKSTDGGVTWTVELGVNLTTAGANLPVWNLAVAPDDVNFLVAVTDGTGAPNGPLSVFASEDGGANWENTSFPPLAVGEYISCVDISVTYGSNNRDIAVGTRDGAGGGTIWVLKAGVGSPSWADQVLPASDVVALKFSPTYTSDSSLVVISSAADTRLHLGSRDIDANTTNWNIVGGYPVLIHDGGYAGTSPIATDIITADLELPSDFSGTDHNFRRFYVSTDTTAAGVQSGVYRVDNTIAYWIKPPTTAPTAGRISSIAYRGTYAEGVLLAGEVIAGAFAPNPSSFGVYIWRTSNPNTTVGTPTWLSSEARKSPTGGVISGFANAQVAWSHDGARAYCGTSSANPTTGGTGPAPQWPFAWTNGVQWD
ncbi:MAG: hypothetical protein H8E40_05145 [Chloroflexi bacterium]|nr:hypothetical protein [Chloroflexota bacterium]